YREPGSPYTYCSKLHTTVASHWHTIGCAYCMKHLYKLVLSAALILASGSVQADTFSFSYEMINPDYVPGEFHGTLTGTQEGNFVTGVTVTSLFINGVEATGTIGNSSAYLIPLPDE